jgi:hypothetical protein
MSRRAIEWAARLYPAQWRQRYGVEFGALLEDSGGGWRALADVLRGALAMRMRSGRIWKFVAVCAAIGAAIAGVLSWRMPKEYVSTAVLRIDADDSMVRERLGQIAQGVLNRTTLGGLIVNNGLYKADRAQLPMEDIVQDMRSHINLWVIGGHQHAFKISFTGSSPEQARHVTGMLVSQFIDKNFEARSARMEVLDPPSLPQRPRSPKSSTLTRVAIGVLLGFLMGLLAVGARRWPVVAAAGVTGALVAFGIASVLPKEYVSTAVVMGDSAQNARALVSDSALLRVIENPALDLYPNERGKMTPAQLAVRMRRDLKILRISAGDLSSPHQVATVSFTYPDGYKAQAVTRDFVARLMSGGGTVVLDPPSDPFQPAKPALPRWIAVGLLLGLLAGIALTWGRRRNPAALAQA